MIATAMTADRVSGIALCIKRSFVGRLVTLYSMRNCWKSPGEMSPHNEGLWKRTAGQVLVNDAGSDGRSSPSVWISEIAGRSSVFWRSPGATSFAHAVARRYGESKAWPDLLGLPLSPAAPTPGRL